MPHSVVEKDTCPVALAIDIGSSSVRAAMFDVDGNQIDGLEHKERYKLTLTPDGGSTVDAARIRRLVGSCLQKVCALAGSAVQQIKVVGMSCHWHSLLGLDSNGNPITPVFMWSDHRSAEDALQLEREVQSQDIRQQTGCRLHSSYWPAKLRWIRRTDPETYASVSHWCGLADWILSSGEISTSHSMASGTGYFDSIHHRWQPINDDSSELIDRFPTLIRFDSPIQPPADLVPAGLNASWFPASGDGGAANIGAGAVGKDRIALTIGTSGALRLAGKNLSGIPIPPELWRYSIHDELDVIGGALSNGGNMMTWLVRLSSGSVLKTNMTTIAKMEPDSHGLTVLPFFAGERSPSWNDRLRATITGMTLDTSASDIYRALLEATAYRFAAVYQAILPFAAQDHMIIANGGALLHSPVWCQILADVLGHPISALQSRAEVSARGAAILALNAGGIMNSVRTDPGIRHVYEPVAGNYGKYAEARGRLESLAAAFNEWERSNT